MTFVLLLAVSAYQKAIGLADNIIVIYTSDQGFYLGEHSWFDKRFMYEQSFRTPLLIRYPKEIKAGITVEKLVQNLDFAPTLLDYAKVQVPEDMQGESFTDLLIRWKAICSKSKRYSKFYSHRYIEGVLSYDKKSRRRISGRSQLRKNY